VKHAQRLFFGEFEVTDPVAYEVYRAKVPDIISAPGGRILVRGGDPQPFDGAMPQRRFVIVEFDSPEAARTFYFSDVYQAVLPFRLNASSGNGFGCLLTGER
jgi:uncharacterized protein (DUF1330 family)